MANHRETIDGNLVKLCKLTRCNEILLDTCTERKIITQEDKELIEKEELPYNRNRNFYAIIRLKDETNFQNLIVVMKEESTAQSGDVLKILEGHHPAPSSQKRQKLENLVEPEKKIIWFNVPDPATSFVGRERELKELHPLVTKNADKDAQVPNMSQLTMGGMEKIALASEYTFANPYNPYASIFNNIYKGNQPAPSNPKRPRLENLVEPEEKRIWFNVPDHATWFVGRENELKELHLMVTRNADKDTQVSIMSQLTSVCGMSGIGKTTLASEYAKEAASFFNSTIWINAETTVSTEKSFRELADEIGDQNYNFGIQNRNNVPISKVVSNTYEYLSRRKCLFVFDNVKEYRSTVAPFIPKSYEPGKIRPYILITGRKPRLVADCKVLGLDVLAIEDAEKFITWKLQDYIGQTDDESVRKLAYKLRCFPIALEHAVSYIQKQAGFKSSFPGKEMNHIEEYLKEFEECQLMPLNHEYQNETMADLAWTVQRTLYIAVRVVLGIEGNWLYEVFQRLASRREETIEIREFEIGFSKEKLGHCYEILEEYSLINRVGKYIHIHQLVQQVIRVQNKEEGREEYNIGRCLSLATRYTKRNYLDQRLELV